MAYETLPDGSKRWVRNVPLGREGKGLSKTPFVSRERGSTEAIRRSRERIRKVGRNSRSNAWRREWRTLKPELERAGVTRCEECGTDENLTPVHSMKRRFIRTKDEMREVAILCLRCHRVADEEMSHPEMRAYIRGLIAKRAA